MSKEEKALQELEIEMAAAAQGKPKIWSPYLEDDPIHKKRNDLLRSMVLEKRELMKLDLDAAKARVEKHGGKSCVSFDPDKGMMPTVLCKMCRKVIVRVQEGETPLYTREIKGKTFCYMPVHQQYTNDYAEVRLLFDDGSAHITNCCKDCAAKAIDGTLNLDAFYAHDLAQWLSHPESQELAAQNAKRHPIKAIPIALEE